MNHLSLIDFFSKPCIICNSDMVKFLRNYESADHHSFYNEIIKITSYNDIIYLKNVSFFKMCTSNMHDKLDHSVSTEMFNILPKINQILDFSEIIEIKNSFNYLSMHEDSCVLYIDRVMILPPDYFKDYFLKNNQDQFLDYINSISLLSE